MDKTTHFAQFHVRLSRGSWTFQYQLRQGIDLTATPIFLGDKKYMSKKTRRYFPKCDALSKKTTNSSLAGAKLIGIKCWYGFLAWKRDSYSAWESGLVSTQVRRLWAGRFCSPWAFNQKFPFWHTVFHLCLYTPNSPLALVIPAWTI